MRTAASSARVFAATKRPLSAPITRCQSTSPAPSAAPTAITVASFGQSGRAAITLAMPLSSTIASRASLSLMRYSSASGPNSIDSGIATAPRR